MKSEALENMATFYMALADKTRLRLLNLMKDDEICVCFFTEVLGDSQPKISRHLAYLRSAGVVKARRDGKWMHYSINEPADEKSRQVLQSALDWLAAKPEMQKDREKYKNECRAPEELIKIVRRAEPFIYDDADVYESEKNPRHQGHNELEEFLL